MPLTITIPDSQDFWDEENARFISVKGQTLVLEHSLISVSKWEQKWKKPFFSDTQKSYEEVQSYIRCMTLNQVNERVYDLLTAADYARIDEYIADPATATTFSNLKEGGPRRSREIITSEIIYYNMISFGIPVEFEKWHINRLITLIRIFSIKGGGEKKMSTNEAAMFQRSLNEKRRAAKRR